MQILNTQMSLQSQSMSLRQEVRTQSIEFTRAVGPNSTAASDRFAAIDRPALRTTTALAEPDATGVEAERQELDPRLEVLMRMIEVLTGRPVRLMRAAELMPTDRAEGYDARGQVSPGAMADRFAAVAARSQTPPASSQTPQASVGWGARVESTVERIEIQAVSFAARGQVQTADGQRIDFELRFELSSTLVESQRSEVLLGDAARQIDPLTFDFAESGAALSDLRFAFDLDSDGRKDSIAVPVSGRGFLAFDRNGNGQIDNGSELFGPSTGQGFAELAALDDDRNGWIDSGDAAWSQLRAWRPDPAGGGGTLLNLDEAGVGAISTQSIATPYLVRSATGQVQGQMQSSSVVLDRTGRAASISQIDLRV